MSSTSVPPQFATERQLGLGCDAMTALKEHVQVLYLLVLYDRVLLGGRIVKRGDRGTGVRRT